MKNLATVARKSNTNNRLPLYYSFKDNAVYTEDGNDRFFVTYLINPNTEKDIESTINWWKNL